MQSNILYDKALKATFVSDERLKTNILYYTEHTLSSYWFYDCYIITYMIWGISLDKLAAVLQIRMDNRDNFGIFIHIIRKKHICDPSLEPSHRDGSNEGPQHMFSFRNKKKSSLNYSQYLLLSGALISSVPGVLHNRIMTPNIQEYLSLRQKVSTLKYQHCANQILLQ